MGTHPRAVSDTGDGETYVPDDSTDAAASGEKIATTLQHRTPSGAMRYWSEVVRAAAQAAYVADTPLRADLHALADDLEESAREIGAATADPMPAELQRIAGKVRDIATSLQGAGDERWQDLISVALSLETHSETMRMQRATEADAVHPPTGAAATEAATLHERTPPDAMRWVGERLSIMADGCRDRAPGIEAELRAYSTGLWTYAGAMEQAQAAAADESLAETIHRLSGRTISIHDAGVIASRIAPPPVAKFRSDPWNVKREADAARAAPIRRRTPPDSMRYLAGKLREEADAEAGPMRGRLTGHAITLETFADEMEADSSIHALPYIRSLIPELDLEDLRQVEADVAAHMPRMLRRATRTAEAMVGGVRVPPPGADAVGAFEEKVRALRVTANEQALGNYVTAEDIDALSDLGHEMAVAVAVAPEVPTGVSRIHLWQVTAWMENMNPARDHRHFRLLVATPDPRFLSHRERIEAVILNEWERRAEAPGRYTVHIQGFWAVKTGFEGYELGPTALHIGGADEPA